MDIQKMTNEERQALIERVSEIYTEYSKPNHSKAFSVKDTEIAKLALIALAALTAEPKEISKDIIREIFMRNGFTIKDGQSDLKDYVYASAYELLRLNAIDNTARQYEALAGWKMVPVEPSKEMRSQIHPIADGNCSHCGNRTTLDCEENMLLSWRDMLEAAPKPEA